MTSPNETDTATSDTRRLAPWMLAAVWGALLFGLLEGVVLALSRLSPPILAPNKVSNEILWVAPLVHLLVLSITALVAAAVYRFLPARMRRWPPMRIAVGVFVFIGAFSAVVSPRLANTISTLVLALGLAVGATRLVSGKEARLERWMRRRLPWIPIALATVAIAVFAHGRLRERNAAAALGAPPANAINVLILMLDTVRKDRFTSDRAPNLTRLAENGAWFEQAWSTTSWSLPSQASVLTGRHSFEHRADFPDIALNPEVLTLGEHFGRRGYATGAFSSNSAWITPEHLGRGFVRFRVYILEDLVRRTIAGRIAERALRWVGLHKAGRGKDASQLSAQFLGFIDDYEDRPFFAYLCYMDVNRTFHRRALGTALWERPATPAEVLATYDTAITTLDAQLGELLAELDRRGALDRTLIVVLSDHGESFGDGILGDHEPSGHGSSLYPEQVQVPMFVVLPGTIAPRQRIGQVVSIRDIPATITALLGDSTPAFPGRALLTATDTTSSRPELATLDYGQHLVRSVFWDGWQYIAYPEEPQREELFNLRVDPSAQHNVHDRAPAQLANGRATMARLHPAQAARADR